MARKNKKQSKKKSKAKKNGRPNNGGVSAAVSIGKNSANMPKQHVMKPVRASKHAVLEAVCKITDPFCAGARNAKWPDGLGAGTMTMPIRAHSSFSTVTGASGGVLCYAGASLPYCLLNAASFATGNYTMNAVYNDMTYSTLFATYAATYRVVSWGIIIRNVVSAMNASGFVIVSRQTTMPAVSSVIASGGTIGSVVETHPIVAGMEIHVIGKPEGTGSKQFLTQNTSTTQVNNGWDVIKVEIVGGYAGSLLDIEFVYNVEFTLPLSQVALTQFVTPIIPVAPKAIEASNLVQTRMNTIVAGTADKVGNAVLAHAADAVEDIFEWGAAFLGL